MALIQDSSTGNPAAACRYRTDCPIEGRSYTVLTCSIFSSSSADTVHNFSPFALHPWRTGGSVVVMVIVSDLCTVTPFIVV